MINSESIDPVPVPGTETLTAVSVSTQPVISEVSLGSELIGSSVPIPDVAPLVTPTHEETILQRRINRSNRSRLERGTRVSGSHGELVPNPKGHGRRVREKIYGIIAKSRGNNKYLVRFDNCKEKECTSNQLRRESAAAGVPSEEISEADRLQMIAAGEDISTEPIESNTENLGGDGDNYEHTPEADLVTEIQEVTNIGDINASADTNSDQVVNRSNPVDYKTKLKAARESISKVLVEEVEITRRKTRNAERMTWTVVESYIAPNLGIEERKRRDEFEKKCGYNDIHRLLVEEGFQDPATAPGAASVPSRSSFFIRPSRMGNCTIFAKMFLSMLYKDWTSSVLKMNHRITKYNNECGGGSKKIRPFTSSEFIAAHALLIGATCYAICGKKLWLKGYDKTNEEDDWASIVECPNFDKHMRLYRFKEFKKFIPTIYESKELENIDPWWKF